MPIKKIKNERVSLFYLYGQQNAGDAAIGLGVLSFLVKKGCRVTAFSRWPKSFPEYHRDKAYYTAHFDNVKIEEGPFFFRRTENKRSLVCYYFSSILSALFGRRGRNVRKAIRRSDIVILNGGNTIRCQRKSDILRLLAFLYPLFIARIYKIPYLIFPQSTSEINALGKKILTPIFSGAQAVWVRELDSLTKFSSLFPNLKFAYGPDMAFHIRSGNGPKRLQRSSKRELNIAVTLRAHTIGDIGELDFEEKNRIRQTILFIMKEITKFYKIRLRLVNQNDKDFGITKEMERDLLKSSIFGLNDCQLLDTRDVYELISIFGGMDLVIGMRLHSIILGLISGSICVGYFSRSWGLKNPGILRRFGLPISYIDEHPGQFSKEILGLLKKRDESIKKILSQIEEEKQHFYGDFDKAIDIKKWQY